VLAALAVIVIALAFLAFVGLLAYAGVRALREARRPAGRRRVRSDGSFGFITYLLGANREGEHLRDDAPGTDD
jgi:hypothetical protein